MNRELLADLMSFAKRLGWNGVDAQTKELEVEDGRFTVAWYESGEATGDRYHVALQINHSPIGQDITFEAAVYAVRYKICTGWHGFSREHDMTDEADRLEPWLHHRWFHSADKRRAFRALHPECYGFSWQRIRECGPPRRSEQQSCRRKRPR